MSITLVYWLGIVVTAFCMYGCATIINGSTQDVPIDVPRGTKVVSASGEEIPLFYKITPRDSGFYIRLERDQNYQLRFSYKGQHLTTFFEGKFNGWWLIPDYLTAYGLIVDAITGAWHSFDGIAVRFPSDSLSKPYIESFEPTPRAKIGAMVLASTGVALPMGNAELQIAFFNFYTFGLGYELTSRLTFLAEFSEGDRINIMPRYTDHRTFASFSTYNLGARFRFEADIYITGGGGLTHVTTDTLKYFDTFRPRLNTAPADKVMGTVYTGIGVSGKYGFIELRQTFGLSKIPLSNGEIGTYETTALGFGINLRF